MSIRKLLTLMVAIVALCGFSAENKKVAVFVQNRTQTPGMDGATGAIRERIVSGLAEIEDLTVVDSTMATDAFNASPNVAKALGCDYVIVVGIVGASSMKRLVGGRTSTVFSLRMSMKVTDVSGAAMDGMPTWSQKLPVLDAAGDPMGFYDTLLDQWAEDAVAAIAQKHAKWRTPTAEAVAAVPFLISTTADRPIAALESQTKGVKSELLAELRKVVGGATVAIDGITVGTAPCQIKATPGLHRLKVSRAWMNPFEETISVTDGGSLEVSLELSAEGIAKWGTMEKVQADAAARYAHAAMERGVKVNIDTTNWRDAALGGVIPAAIIKEN